MSASTARTMSRSTKALIVILIAIAVLMVLATIFYGGAHVGPSESNFN